MRPDPSLYRIQKQDRAQAGPSKESILVHQHDTSCYWCGFPILTLRYCIFQYFALLDTRLTNPSVRVNGVGAAAPVETAEWTRRHFSRDGAIVGTYRLEQRQVLGLRGRQRPAREGRAPRSG